MNMNHEVTLKKPKEPQFTVDGIGYYIKKVGAVFIWDGEYDVSIFPMEERFDKRKKFDISEDRIVSHQEEAFEKAFQYLENNYIVWADHENQFIDVEYTGS